MLKFSEGKRQFIVERRRVEFALLEADEAKKTGAKGNFIGAMSAIGMEAGRITSNGTLYPTAWVKAQLARLGPLMVNAAGKGEVAAKADHSYGVLRNCVRWLSASLDQANNVQLLGGILGNATGENIKAQCDGGFVFDLSSVAYGCMVEKVMDSSHPDWALNRDKEGIEFWEISEDSELITWDLVDDGSNEGAKSESLHVFDRLEDLGTREEEMEIKTLADLKKAVDKDVFEAIMAEALKGTVKAEDAEKTAKAKVDEAVEQAKKDALKDGAKVAEAAGLPEDVLAYAVKHLEALTKMVKDGLVPAGKELTEAEAKIAELTEQVNKLADQVEKADKEARAAAKQRDAEVKALNERLRREAVRKIVDECTKGEAGKAMLEHDLEGFDFPEGFEFDPDNEASVKAAKDHVAEAVKQRKDFYKQMNVTFEGQRPEGQGNPSGSPAGETDEVEIKKLREAFDKANPDLVPNEKNFNECFNQALADNKGREFIAAYGKGALAVVPLN